MAAADVEFTTISPLAVTAALAPTVTAPLLDGASAWTRASSTFTVTEAALLNPATLVAEHESIVPAV